MGFAAGQLLVMMLIWERRPEDELEAAVTANSPPPLSVFVDGEICQSKSLVWWWGGRGGAWAAGFHIGGVFHLKKD